MRRSRNYRYVKRGINAVPFVRHVNWKAASAARAAARYSCALDDVQVCRRVITSSRIIRDIAAAKNINPVRLPVNSLPRRLSHARARARNIQNDIIHFERRGIGGGGDGHRTAAKKKRKEEGNRSIRRIQDIGGSDSAMARLFGFPADSRGPSAPRNFGLSAGKSAEHAASISNDLAP